ncbi:PTS transporter subunit EIIC [Vibrio lentus]|nr:PTS transporter subunit EIIC [Vibrio lentus]
MIPAMLAGVALAFIETNLKRIVPSCCTLLSCHLSSIILSVILAHAFIGPFGRMLGDGVAFAAKVAMTGDFLRFLVQWSLASYTTPLVITGLHHTTNAVDLQLMQDLGGTPIWPLIALSNIAQASAVVGIIILRSKREPRQRTSVVPAAISAYLGVTEPAMYGINLKYKFQC